MVLKTVRRPEKSLCLQKITLTVGERMDDNSRKTYLETIRPLQGRGIKSLN